ncbi:MAG: DegT/DnrJ/EryC1/StrS family aminotransferase [Patescibacteria group bacterium]
MNNIPIYKPDLSGNEKAYVDECLDSTWISSKGSFIEKFETGFAKFTGIDNAVSVSNGTVALHIALLALGIGPDDEVIVPTLTYIASVNAITYVGAKPVFIDSLESTWQMDPEDIARKITDKTKAIMVVHLYGQPCDMDSIAAIAKDNDLKIIEDCAEAIGGMYNGQHVGNVGDVAAFSFFGNKTITTGEGGMVLSNDRATADKARKLKGQGLAEGREYWHDIIGYNYRLTNMSAAVGVAQLERIDDFITAKFALAQAYKENLTAKGITFHPEAKGTTNSYWMCSILVDEPSKRDGLREALKAKGIETRPLFFPIHTMPMYQDEGNYPVAVDLAARGINLPSWPGLESDDIKLITDTINEFMETA